MNNLFRGKIAEQYDDWYIEPMGRFIDQIESSNALELFAPVTGSKILDAGCGTGNFSVKLKQQGCKITGIDLSKDMLFIARQKAQKLNLDIEFKQMDLYKLDFPDKYFDGVFSMAAFEFIKEPSRAYAEMFRVVKPGGKILIATINRDSSWGKLYMNSASKDSSSVFNHAHFKNMEELKALDSINLQASKECLFIPPDADESLLTLESEKALSSTNAPGFIMALWQKL